MAKTFRLKNESKRKFQFGKAKDWKFFNPSDVGTFDEETAADLLKHKGVVDIDNITINFDHEKAVDFSADSKKEGKAIAKSNEAPAEKTSEQKMADALRAKK